MADDPHASAYLSLLSGIPQDAYDGEVPDPAPDPATNPYVVVYLNVHYMRLDRYTQLPGRAVARAYVHSVGGSASAARKVSAAARGALMGIVPAVPGRSCGPIVHEQSIPPQRDESLGQYVMDQVDVYRFDTEPA